MKPRLHEILSVRWFDGTASHLEIAVPEAFQEFEATAAAVCATLCFTTTAQHRHHACAREKAVIWVAKQKRPSSELRSCLGAWLHLVHPIQKPAIPEEMPVLLQVLVQVGRERGRLLRRNVCQGDGPVPNLSNFHCFLSVAHYGGDCRLTLNPSANCDGTSSHCGERPQV